MQNMQNILKKIVPVVLVILFSSCFNEKKLAYFQKAPNQTDTIVVSKAYEAKIQPGDILSLYVNSLSPEASSFFNPYSANTVPSDAGGSSNGLSQSAAPGFLVSNKGEISLPLIGNVNVGGLTTAETHDLLLSKLKEYLKEPTIIVRFLNYKISILGEVIKPGVYVVPNERITIPEAITMAGDLTAYGKRSEIQVIREIDGKKEFGQIDLSDRSVFTSPYYYLHANDIVYVKATKSKVVQSDLTIRLLPIAISLVTVILLIIK
ncbi:polysaccharide biosynthesis/export family protein [Mucilaginibacter polytrichastri]|uniref:Uncharacterized protein n=1 Tax=Mucilaginibacter polytrichastri TaxID=1302689 RepID=A0A1Q5ZTS6_9SPHI|nr:polysaccharide biosynthesis/export family protein [Mucilaginibacter polytrichastri]OKS85133.1 hypothetical protein RG47T_0577 [Mucilaginibacter polytrichastri]SFS43987.1 polysaccharide export outer membrane protein [Mucilaginibacter polytrichastri]